MHIRVLGRNEYVEAISLFSDGIRRDWPEEARGTGSNVRRELEAVHPCYIGRFEEGELVGTVGFGPLYPVLDEDEDRQMLEEALFARRVDSRSAAFLSALAVRADFVGTGVMRDLIDHVVGTAAYHGYGWLVGHTARPSPKYPAVRALPRMQRLGFAPLLLPKRVFYKFPPDLEKVWVVRET